MKKRNLHSAEQIVKKLRDSDAMIASDKSVGEVVQSLEVSEAILIRWRSQYGGMFVTNSYASGRIGTVFQKND